MWAVQVRVVQAEIVVHAGDPERGLHLLWTAGGGPELPTLAPRRRLRAWDLAAQAAAALGDPTSSQRYANLADDAARHLASVARQGVAARALMQAQRGLRDPRAALRYADRAIERFAEVELGLDLAQTMVMAATTAAKAPPSPGLQARLAEAEEQAHACGSRRLLDEIAELRTQLRDGTDAPRGPIAELTAREQEIATLASSGITSNDMAQRLHLSVRTVDTHLSRIYRKLRVNGRVALASMVLTNSPGRSDVEPE
jgi:DNA-binding CsgD family transcriptional regulator